MKSQIHSTEESGREAALELSGKLDTPEIIFLFPTTIETSSNGINEITEHLTEEFDCPVVGVSVGAFATPGKYKPDHPRYCSCRTERYRF